MLDTMEGGECRDGRFQQVLLQLPPRGSWSVGRQGSPLGGGKPVDERRRRFRVGEQKTPWRGLIMPDEEMMGI